MKWIKKDVDPEVVRRISTTFGTDLLTASILVRRGITEPGQLRFFLEDDARNLHNPFLFARMEDVVDRLLHAKDEAERVLVYGDADTDGITSTVILHETLTGLGVDCSWRVPVGNDPYGLTTQAVDEHASHGGTLIVTVDCGISNHREVLYARERGIDVIVLDHHRLQSGNVPEAFAVIDPKLDDSGYPFRDLAGCGVAYKVACALRFACSDLYKQHVALLDIRPEGDGYILEAIRLTNLVETGRILEHMMPGETDVSASAVARFLRDRQIFVWGGDRQRRHLASALGTGVDVYFHDIAGQIGAVIPPAAGKTLEELAEISRMGRYSEKGTGPIDIFRNLFTSYVSRGVRTEGELDDSLLQLVALGSIADLMPMKDENRILIKRGIAALNRAPRTGLAELMSVIQIERGTLTAHDIAWQITPVINASGRMGSPDVAVSLFLSGDRQERLVLSSRLAAMNLERRKMGSESWEAILPLARENFLKNGEKMAFVGTERVPRGITGLIASRITGVFKAPSLVASFQPDGTVVGSIRSVRGFTVTGLLAACSDLFIDYGGHDAAAGFSLPPGSWEVFLERAERYIAGIDIVEEEKTILVDAELPHSYVTPGLLDLARMFEPTGEECSALVFMARKVPMIDAQIVGKGEKNHLKLTLDFGRHKWPALLWDGAERLERDFSFRNRDSVDLLFKVTVNRWNGMETPQMEMLDIRKTRDE